MSASFLLDTHVLLWLLGDPDRVPERVRAELADRENPLLVTCHPPPQQVLAPMLWEARSRPGAATFR